MMFDYSDMQNLQRDINQKDINIDIPEDFTDRQAINYLAGRLTEANRTIARLATILQDFQRVIKWSMDDDYKILQSVEKDLYNHIHSFHSMMLITKSKEEDNNNESNIP